MKERKLISYWIIFSKLGKHRLSLLVSFSATAGFLLANGEGFIHFSLLFIGVFLMSSGASALNQYQEKGLDAQMKRTKTRPIPAGKITPLRALLLSCILIVSGVLILLSNGILPAILGLLNIVFYNLIYTPLKIRTAFSIIPGALVGAVPPLIGWTFAEGTLLHPTIIFIAIFMFLWQLPHFWLLLIMLGEEYEKVGFLSISKFFNSSQIKHIVFFWASFTSVFLFFFPVFKIHIDLIFLAILIVINLIFIYWFKRLLYSKEEGKNIRGAFILINSYLFLALAVFIMNSVI